MAEVKTMLAYVVSSFTLEDCVKVLPHNMMVTRPYVADEWEKGESPRFRTWPSAYQSVRFPTSSPCPCFVIFRSLGQFLSINQSITLVHLCSYFFICFVYLVDLSCDCIIPLSFEYQLFLIISHSMALSS
jgi:hypothetical protein